MLLSERFDRALLYASTVHGGQTRKGTSIPYLAHLLAVASIVLEHGGSEDEAIAALLHDAPEDQGGKRRLDHIRARFGDAVADIVAQCSDTFEHPKPDWRTRKERYVAHVAAASPSARLVSAADKLHNARAILADLRVGGDAVFARFTAGKAETLWYYQAMVQALRATGDSPLVQELARTVDELVRLAGA